MRCVRSRADAAACVQMCQAPSGSDNVAEHPLADFVHSEGVTYGCADLDARLRESIAQLTQHLHHARMWLANTRLLQGAFVTA